MTKTIVAWDLGATKCTAGIIEYHDDRHDLVCKKHYTLKLTEANSLENLISKIESGLDCSLSQIDAICIGASGHYNGESLLHENGYPYPMAFATIATRLKWPSYAVIHD